jgi:hypothetical protein
MGSGVRDPVGSDVRHRVFHKRKPIQEPIRSAYDHRKGVYASVREEFVEDQVQILPRAAAHEIGTESR